MEEMHARLYELASDLAGMVKREGMQDFTHGQASGRTTATLCGLSVLSDNGVLLRVHASDIDMAFDHPANDHPAVCRFRKGTVADLKSWHRRLNGLYGFRASRNAA